MIGRAISFSVALVGACDARPHLVAGTPAAAHSAPEAATVAVAHEVEPPPEAPVVVAECEQATDDGAIIMAAHGTVGAYTIYGQRGVLACGETGASRTIECIATGPGQFGATGPTQSIYALGRGESATLVVDRNGASCHLNGTGE